jgi:hypothetical protein
MYASHLQKHETPSFNIRKRHEQYQNGEWEGCIASVDFMDSAPHWTGQEPSNTAQSSVPNLKSSPSLPLRFAYSLLEGVKSLVKCMHIFLDRPSG